MQYPACGDDGQGVLRPQINWSYEWRHKIQALP